jgi:hypothetical protein
MKNSTAEGRIFTDQYYIGSRLAMDWALQALGSSRDRRMVKIEQAGGRTFALRKAPANKN